MYIPRRDPKRLRWYCAELEVTQFQWQTMNGDVYQGEILPPEISDEQVIEVEYAWLYVAQEFVTVGPKDKEEVFVKSWRYQPIVSSVKNKVSVHYNHFYRQSNKGRIKIELDSGEVAYFISKDNPVNLKHDPEDTRLISIHHLLLPISSFHVINEKLQK